MKPAEMIRCAQRPRVGEGFEQIGQISQRGASVKGKRAIEEYPAHHGVSSASNRAAIRLRARGAHDFGIVGAAIPFRQQLFSFNCNLFQRCPESLADEAGQVVPYRRGKGRATPATGNGYFQLTPFENRRKRTIAQFRGICHRNQDIARLGILGDTGVDFNTITGRHHQKDPIQVIGRVGSSANGKAQLGLHLVQFGIGG